MNLPDILTDEKCKELLKEALEKSHNAEDLWLPRGQGSGAAVLTRSGRIYSASHKSRPSGGGIHAETLALNIALEHGYDDPIIAVALVSSNPKARNRFWVPCLHCRQEYWDSLLYSRRNNFVNRDHEIFFVCGKPDLTYETHTLKELAPYSWEPADQESN